MKETLYQLILDQSERLLDMSDRIFDNPEYDGEEHFASPHGSCHGSDSTTPRSMAALRRTRGPLSQLCLSVAFTVYSTAWKINTAPFPKAFQ